MGMSYSTYFGFGAQIAECAYDHPLWRSIDDPEDINDMVRDLGVSYLLAGDYDHDRLFLVTYCQEVDYGDVARVDPFSLGHQENDWKEKLLQAASVLGVELEEEPAWFVVPDVS